MTLLPEAPVENLRASATNLIQLLHASADPARNDFAFIAEMAEGSLADVEAGSARRDASLLMRGVSRLASINKAVADNNGSDAEGRALAEVAFRVFKDAVEVDRSILGVREGL